MYTHKELRRNRLNLFELLKVMNAPAICNCDLHLGPTMLKCKLVPDIIIIYIYLKFYRNQFIKSVRIMPVFPNLHP